MAKADYTVEVKLSPETMEKIDRLTDLLEKYADVIKKMQQE